MTSNGADWKGPVMEVQTLDHGYGGGWNGGSPPITCRANHSRALSISVKSLKSVVDAF